ncbi:hypothetical protein Efla_004817 [Eimeria flavescens]
MQLSIPSVFLSSVTSAFYVQLARDRVRGIGALSCRVCGASYNRAISRLDEGIDVYGDWIDACVSANAEAAKEAQQKLEKTPPGGPPHGGGGPPRGPPTLASAGAGESASEAEADDSTKRKKDGAALSRLKATSREAESEGYRSSSDEVEGSTPRGPPDTSEGGGASRKRLKVERNREEDEAAAAGEASDESETEKQTQNAGSAEVGGVLEQYRREAEENEDQEEEDNALFHDDE